MMTHGTDPDDIYEGQLELADLRLRFPGYRIWRQATGDYVRLVAVSQLLGVSPHTVVMDGEQVIGGPGRKMLCRVAAEEAA